MLDIKYIRENPQKVKEACKQKQVICDIDRLLAVYDDLKKHKEVQQQANSIKNRGSEKIGRSFDPIIKTTEISDTTSAVMSHFENEGFGNEQEVSKRIKELEEEFIQLQYGIPNIPLDDVPRGKDESGNQVVRKWGEPKKFDFAPKDHLTLGTQLEVIDTEKAATITGARFAYLKGDAAVLEFALVQYTLEVLTSEKIVKKIADSVEKGYSPKPFIPIVPPVMIRPDVFRKMGRLSEQDKEERYYLQQDDLYLIGSAEHTLGPLHMDEVLQEKGLPLRYLGFSTAFRREAGSYGKDMKGILRVHQFDKLEMESFCTPENSLKEQNFLVAFQEYLMQGLQLPYQVVNVCTGDMGKPDARQIDIETWLPGQGSWRETHTADLIGDYQARRLRAKIKRWDGTTEYAYMNDATVLAMGRTLIAIMENYQQEDGSIAVPEVLRPLVPFTQIKS